MTVTALVEAEQKSHELLISCETRLEHCLDDGYRALREIHDSKLYKADGYSTFKEYCEQRWGWSKTHAYRLIDYSKIADKLKEEGIEHIPSEGQIRPVMKLRRLSKNEDDFLQKATGAVRIAMDTAPGRDGVQRVTASHTESTLSHFGMAGRKSSPKGDVIASELRAALTKLAHCQALKESGTDFVEQHGEAAFPNGFDGIVQFLADCLETLQSVQE